MLGAFAAQFAVALESQRLQAEAAAAETLMQGNELRTALLAAVSHDLRTPLASIKASARASCSDDVSFTDEQARALLDTIDVEADRLNDLVGNLLDMSRIQTGALVVKRQAVGLDEVIGGALDGLPDRGHVIQLDVSETLPVVDADPVLLERAIANIVDNALQFAPPGEPVRVEAGAIAGRVDLRVVDTGPGIPLDAREDVFRPFQRLGDSPNGTGVGLGLAVARGFVEAMGGDLTAEDTPGGGTTMVLSLPEAARGDPRSSSSMTRCAPPGPWPSACAPTATRSTSPTPGEEGLRPPPATTPTSSSSTSGSRASTGSTSSRRCGGGRRCR